jgi:hypothetical protein
MFGRSMFIPSSYSIKLVAPLASGRAESRNLNTNLVAAESLHGDHAGSNAT